MPTTSLTLLIPAYNEGENILTLFEKIKAEVPASVPWKALIIYDFAEDSTRPFAEKLQREDPRIQTFQQDRKRGLKGALEFGFSKIQEGYALCMMADSSDRLSDVEVMYQLANTESPSLISASRFAKGGGYVGGSRKKQLLTAVVGKFLSLCGLPTQDPTNHFKMYKMDWLEKQKIESANGFPIALELTVKAALQKEKILEIPTVWTDRTLGKSNFKFSYLRFYLRWLIHYLFNFI